MKNTAELMSALRITAETLGGGAADTILRENCGKHLLELQLILEHLPVSGRVLDIGGGVGVNLMTLRRMRPDAELVLVDRFAEYTDQNRMGSANAALQHLRAANVDVQMLDFWPTYTSGYGDACFDVVTCFDVIEHLPGHPMQLLGELHRVLKPHAVLLLGGPNAVSLMKRAKLGFGVHPYMPFEHWVSNAYYEHFREYSAAEYAELTQLAGFQPTRVIRSAAVPQARFRNHFFRGHRSPWSPIRLALGAHALIELIAPALRHSVYVVAQKAAES